MKKQKTNVLREYRESISLSQAELGQLIGVNCRTVSAYEVGSRKPSLKVGLKLAKVFKVRLEDIFPEYNQEIKIPRKV